MYLHGHLDRSTQLHVMGIIPSHAVSLPRALLYLDGLTRTNPFCTLEGGTAGCMFWLGNFPGTQQRRSRLAQWSSRFVVANLCSLPIHSPDIVPKPDTLP